MRNISRIFFFTQILWKTLAWFHYSFHVWVTDFLSILITVLISQFQENSEKCPWTKTNYGNLKKKKALNHFPSYKTIISWNIHFLICFPFFLRTPLIQYYIAKSFIKFILSISCVYCAFRGNFTFWSWFLFFDNTRNTVLYYYKFFIKFIQSIYYVNYVF